MTRELKCVRIFPVDMKKLNLVPAFFASTAELGLLEALRSIPLLARWGEQVVFFGIDTSSRQARFLNNELAPFGGPFHCINLPEKIIPSAAGFSLTHPMPKPKSVARF